MDEQMNDAFDREIESLLAVEPSPEFVARVRARVAEEPEPKRWWTSWTLAVAGAVAMAILAVIAWPSSEPSSSVTTTIPAPRITEIVEPVMPPTVTPPPATSQAVPRQTPTPIAVAVTTSGDRVIDIDLPAVVIAENEVRTFATLVASIRQRRFDVAVPAAPDLEAPIEIKELPPIEPIEIEPIVKLAALHAEGERP
jgi:hypothetical protein